MKSEYSTTTDKVNKTAFKGFFPIKAVKVRKPRRENRTDYQWRIYERDSTDWDTYDWVDCSGLGIYALKDDIVKFTDPQLYLRVEWYEEDWGFDFEYIKVVNGELGRETSYNSDTMKVPQRLLKQLERNRDWLQNV